MTSASRRRVIVSNSSPLIHLARIGRLELLKILFNEIMIPYAVYYEVVIEGHRRPGAEEIARAKWIRVMKIKDTKLKHALILLLDEGEAETIVLALELNASLVILDEREARFIAKKMGLRVIGTLGILLRAKRLNLISSLREELSKLKQTGFYIGDDVKRRILKEASEI